MSDVHPFRSFRPAPEMVQAIASSQYDVVDREEAMREATGRPHCFLHVTRPEIDLPEVDDAYDPRVYAQGARAFAELISSQLLRRDAHPCFYVYRQRLGDHEQTGIVAAASVAEYDQGTIRKHELTRQVKEDDRARHVEALNANTGPVFLTYRHQERIDQLVATLCQGEAAYRFVATSGSEHSVWIADAPSIVAELQAAFQQVPMLYVADGHHRSASASRVAAARREKNPHHRGDEPYNYFMAVLFPDNQLQVMGYHRVVADLNGLDADEFLRAIDASFGVEAIDGAASALPRKGREFGMCLLGRWYRLTARHGSVVEDDPLRRLDVAILQENLLSPVLAIADPRTDPRIDFVGGIRGMAELERRVNNGAAVAFAVHPVSVEQLLAVADRGLIMPPKSTWFEPKLQAGLFVRTLD